MRRSWQTRDRAEEKNTHLKKTKTQAENSLRLKKIASMVAVYIE